jgi:HEAT repeat protein
MKPAIWMLLAALPLAAQPKLLVNAKTDTRSAASGLEREFKSLLTAQPQPAWIGYSVPSTRANNLGCDYVRDSSLTSGVVHLEPPDQVIVLFRVENNQLNRIRSISPYCEIDAGGVPVHWLTDVQPPQSVALLTTLVSDREGIGGNALSAIGHHGDPAADQALEKFIAAGQPENVRMRAVSYIGSRPRGFDLIKKVIASDSDSRVRERAVSSLSNSRQPEALDLLISIARSDNDQRLRSQAVSGLGRKSGPKIVATLTAVIENDREPSVRKRAISALQSMPDGEGVPILIQMARTQRDLDMRKQAMSSLQNSRDPRALAFFEEIIKK